jgi:hypothetical protein
MIEHWEPSNKSKLIGIFWNFGQKLILQFILMFQWIKMAFERKAFQQLVWTQDACDRG